MGRKLSDIEDGERKAIENELEAVSSKLGMDAWESYGTNKQKILNDQIGMCSSCRNLQYCKTEFGNIWAKCSEFEIKLNGQNRITECNEHSPRNVLSLSEMYSIAYLIDISKEKVEGFISKNPKLRTKKEK